MNTKHTADQVRAFVATKYPGVLNGALAQAMHGASAMGEEQKVAALGEMLKALLAVGGEVFPDIRPTSMDSYLPPEVVAQVASAIKTGAEALGAMPEVVS